MTTRRRRDRGPRGAAWITTATSAMLALGCALALPVATPADADGATAARAAEIVLEPEAALDPSPATVFPAAGGPTIGVDEIYRGQRGFGVSVFTGSQLERFEVEVLGVLRNATPGASSIMARLSGQGLEQSGVIAGMSGSPVYIDGRLAGAVAFGWNFSKDAIAGITPIGDMRRLAGLEAGAPSAGHQLAATPPPPVSLAGWLAGEVPEDLLETSLRNLVPHFDSGASSGLLWTVSGFGETSRSLLSTGLGRVAVGGAGAGGSGMSSEAAEQAAAGSLEPGSPVAAVLIRGDLALAATGTVTDRVGDQILAFGHPFLDFGPVDLPMAAAEVITIVPSTSNSFKLTNMGPVVGAFREDRTAGMLGRLGAQARLIPLTLRIDGAGLVGPQEFHMEVAQLSQITPTLLAIATLGSLESAGHREGAQGLDLHAKLRLAGHGEVSLEQSFDGPGVGVQAAVHLLSFAAMAVQTPLEEVQLESVEVELTRSSQVRLAKIVGAYPERTVVRPGETVGIQVELVAHGGARSRLPLRVEIPDDLAGGRYFLLIGDGISSDAARFQLQPAEPQSYPQLLDVLRSLHSRRELVVLGLVQDPGLVVGGDALPRLPGSVRSLWSTATTTGAAAPMPLAIARQQTEPTDLPLEGIVRVDLEVRRP